LVKDAFWQIAWRILSAVWGFAVTLIMAPYLWPLRYWDYYTILKYFAIWSAFADFGTYVIALRELGKIKDDKVATALEFGKYTGARYFLIAAVYVLALIIALFIPSYTSNPYIAWWLVIWMLFSASFLAAGIQQIPLQLYWKMEKITVALTISRIVQIAVLAVWVYFIWPNVTFDSNHPNNTTIMAFAFVMGTVLLSGIVQNIYVHIASKKILPVKVVFDFKFIFALIKRNLKYWLGYYISSFHFLLVSILLSVIFPTVKDFDYVGIWSFALSLIEVLLIIPSALGNSFIHKISSLTDTEKKNSYWNLFIFIIWIGFVFLINLCVFNHSIIHFVWWDKYISTPWIWWSEAILPYLSVVLLLSFIKQIYNYYFVTFDYQNDLLKVNFIWLVIGLVVWIPLLMKYNILWWIITQVLLEVLYVIGAIYIAFSHKIQPNINYKSLWKILLLMILMFGVWYFFATLFDYKSFLFFFMFAALLNVIILLVSFKPIKSVLKEI